jgi:uncharacterized RDD family membrane protein YckC
MTTQESYIQQVVEKLPPGSLRDQIAMELRSLIADRLEQGSSVDEAIRQLGDPAVLAESYLASIPLVSAPLGRRIVAKLLDLFLMVTPVVLAVALGVWALRIPGPLGEPFPYPLLVLAVALIGLGSFLYPMISEYRTGQTIGKRVFGLRAVTESGARISLGQAFLRQLPMLLQIFMVDALFALFTRNRQRAFELITKTRVVDAREHRHGVGMAAVLSV